MVPRRMCHIWIGPHPAPRDWMESWRTKHPDREYRLYDNDYLLSRRFRTQNLVNEYCRRGKWAGVSDLMRYEILYEDGGFIAEADSVCLNPVDELLTDDTTYTVYELPEGRTGMMSPFLASVPCRPVLKAVIDRLVDARPAELNDPWHSTGTGFLRRFFAENPILKRDLHVFPSHYFIPRHYKGDVYQGTDRIYAEQMWGTTTKSYDFRKSATAIYKAASKQRSETLVAELVSRYPAS